MGMRYGCGVSRRNGGLGRDRDRKGRGQEGKGRQGNAREGKGGVQTFQMNKLPVEYSTDEFWTWRVRAKGTDRGSRRSLLGIVQRIWSLLATMGGIVVVRRSALISSR